MDLAEYVEAALKHHKCHTYIHTSQIKINLGTRSYAQLDQKRTHLDILLQTICALRALPNLNHHTWYLSYRWRFNSSHGQFDCNWAAMTGTMNSDIMLAISDDIMIIKKLALDKQYPIKIVNLSDPNYITQVAPIALVAGLAQQP